MIKFQCPNGHPLNATDDRAGTAAKCPKCQVPLVVPTVSTTNGIGAGSGKLSPPLLPGEPGTVSTKSGRITATASQSGSQLPVTDDIVVFLCPNGHKLNSPAKLKGKAGQCPHCGAKFRIPEDDEEEEFEDFEEELEDQQVAESMTEEEFAAEDVDEIDIEEVTELEGTYGTGELEPFEEAPPTVIDAFIAPAAVGMHPYANVIARLWSAKEIGQEIDLYLQKGEIFTPELFAESLIQPQFGVFGRREKEGGGYTLTMIPWDTIVRIEIRNVRQVPVGILR